MLTLLKFEHVTLPIVTQLQLLFTFTLSNKLQRYLWYLI